MMQLDHAPPSPSTGRVATPEPTETRSRIAPTPRKLRGTAYPAVVSAGLSAVATLQVARWDRALRHLEEEQEKTLRAIVRHSAGTEFGRRYELSRVSDYAYFARHVPIGDYDSFSPFIERMRKGRAEPRSSPSSSSTSATRRAARIRAARSSSRSRERQIRPSRTRRRRHADALPRVVGRRGTFLRRLHARPLPADDDEEGGARPHHLEPRADVDADAGDHAPRLPARRRRAGSHRELRREARRHRRALPRLRRPRRRGDDVLVHPPLREGPRRGAAKQGVRAALGLATSGRTSGCSSAAASPQRRTSPCSATLIGRDDATLVDTYNATEGGDLRGERLTRASAACSCSPTAGRSSSSSRSIERDRAFAAARAAVGRGEGPPLRHRGDDRRRASTPTSSATSSASRRRTRSRMEFMGRLSGCLSVTQELTTHVEIERAVAHAVQACVPCRTLDFGAAADVGVDGTAKSRYVLFVEFEEGADPGELRRRSPRRSTRACASRTASTASTARRCRAPAPARASRSRAGGAQAVHGRSHARERPGQVPAHPRRHEEEAPFEVRRTA